MSEAPRTIVFRREDHTANVRRYYAITVTRTLYHAHALEIVRGRIGFALKRYTEEFTTHAQLTSRWRELVGRRRRHGYAEDPTP